MQKSRLNSKSKKSKAVLANLIAPGIGQLTQKRWLSGTIYLLASLLGLAWIMYTFVKIMIQTWQSAMNGAPLKYSLMELFIPFIAIIVIWIISYIDIFIFAPSNESLEKHEEETENDKKS